MTAPYDLPEEKARIEKIAKGLLELLAQEGYIIIF
jgi:hypothetical protein